ncbi:MAG: hypothetical protein FWD90_06755 [Defluviitaleaceae bacterium]|nr:hypothetical protein [Defluviitaleaceae bacterium]
MNQEAILDVQHSTQELMNDLIPIEITLNAETTSKLDSLMIQSCRELHAFITHLYTDIYDNPDDYGLLIDDKETRNRAFGFLNFVWEGIPDGELINDSLVWIPGFAKKINHHKGINKLLAKTPYSVRQRLDFMQRYGLHIEEKEGGAYITNTEYPHMFLSLQKLRQAAKKHYAGSVVYRNCEFRLLANPKYQPTLADIMHNRVSSETRDFLFQLDAYAREQKLKPEYRVKECIYYRYKGKRVLSITIRRYSVSILIDIGDIDRINKQPYPDDFKAFVKKNMGYCTHCFPHHGGGKKVVLFGKQVGVCGRESLNIKNPKPSQFENIVQAIDFGCDVYR